MPKKPQTKRINVVLNTDILKGIDRHAKEMTEDRSTAIRQLLLLGMFHRQADGVIKLYRERQITLRQIAEMLDIDYWDAQDLLAAKGVPIMDSTESEIKQHKALIGSLAYKTKG